jgi:hypothetical protein
MADWMRERGMLIDISDQFAGLDIRTAREPYSALEEVRKSASGQSDRCVRAVSRITGQRNGASRPFDHSLADGEAKTGASSGAGAGRIAAVKAVEDVGQRVRGNTVAVILNKKLDGVLAKICFDLDLRIRRAVLDGIHQKVGDHKPAIFSIERDGASTWGQIAYGQLHLARGGNGFKVGDGLRYALVQIAFAVAGCACGAALNASHGQHFGDKLFNAGGVGESTLVARLVLPRCALTHAYELER